MANETVVTTSSYVSVISSASITSGGVSAESTSVAAAITDATEEKYPLLDFKLVADTTHVADETIDLYRRPSDGTNDSPAVTASYKPHYCGSFTLNGTTGTYYYLYGVANHDPEDTFYLYSNCAGTEDFTLHLRTRTYGN